MTTQMDGAAPSRAEGDAPVGADLTGRDRMIRNVLSSWGGHLVFVMAGFVIPRMIDRHVGQTALGVWDLSWSVVSYFNLAVVGTGSSVNRYVAKHRAENDPDGVNRAVSSIMCVQMAAALLIATMTAASTWVLPWVFGERLGPDIDPATSVVALLGASLAIQVIFDAFRGVITGCHRWDLYNGVNAGFQAVTMVAMIVALSGGGGLTSLALVHLCGVSACEITRAAMAFRVCPELRIRFGNVTWSQARRMVAFGAKTWITFLAQLLLFQGNSILVARYLGVGALAVYSRPGALVRHVATFSSKFAFVLTPTASSLQAGGRHTELRELLVTSTQYGACLTLPLLLLLAVLGDPILGLWMGPRYEQGLVLAVLALGRSLPLSQQPVETILIGLNLHGWLGLANLLTALWAIGLGMITVDVLGWGLVGAALSLTVPLMVGNGIFVVVFASRQLALPLTEYVRRAFAVPIACALPFALSLGAIRLLVGDRPLVAVALGCAAGPIVLGPLYWRYVVSGGLREKIRGAVTGKLHCGSAVPTSDRG